MKDARREPGDEETLRGWRDERTGVRLQAIKSGLAQRPTLPSEEECREDPRAMLRFQLALSEAAQTDTALQVMNEIDRREEEKKRRAVYDRERREDRAYMEHISAEVKAAADRQTAFQRAVQGELRAIRVDLDGVITAQQDQGKQIGELAEQVRKQGDKFVSSMTDHEGRRHESEERVMGRIEQLENRMSELERLVWADVKARSKEAHGSPASEEGGAGDDPSGPEGPAGSE